MIVSHSPSLGRYPSSLNDVMERKDHRNEVDLAYGVPLRLGGTKAPRRYSIVIALPFC